MMRTRLLLVEDNPAEGDLAVEALSDIVDGADIVVARDGQSALDFAWSAEPPNLILLDINMPGLGGSEVLARLRANAATRVIPVIILSSSDHSRDIRRCYELGANCYLVKPLAHKDFV